MGHDRSRQSTKDARTRKTNTKVKTAQRHEENHPPEAVEPRALTPRDIREYGFMVIIGIVACFAGYHAWYGS